MAADNSSFSIQASVTKLPKKDVFGHCDPYFRVFYNGVQRYTSEIISNVKQATFDQFVVQVTRPTDSIEFKFFDKDAGIKDDFIGEVCFSGEQFLMSHMAGGQVKAKLNDKAETRLELSLFRVPPENLVQFDIEVDGLPKVDYAGWCDPYILIKSADTQRTLYKTRIQKNKKQARWKCISLDVRYSANGVVLELYDYDGKWSNNDMICATQTVDLRSICNLDYDIHDLALDHSKSVGALTDDFKISIRSRMGSNKRTLQTTMSTLSLQDAELYRKPEYGQKLWEGNVKVQRGGLHGKVRNADKFLKGASDAVTARMQWSHKKLIINQQSMVFIEHLDNRPSHVMIIDRQFTVRNTKSSGRELEVDTLERKARVKFADKEACEVVLKILSDLQTRVNSRPPEHASFAPIRWPKENSSHEGDRCEARWFVQGRDFFSYLYTVLIDAKEEIYITDWFLSPKVILMRDPEIMKDPEVSARYQLYNILIDKARQGVRVRVQIFGPPDMAGLNIGAVNCDEKLNHLHENIQCMRHMSGIEDAKLWSHHEKLVVVDQQVAFVGGMDLCSGRYDDDDFDMYDFTAPYRWPGKDYRNTFLFHQGDPAFDKWDTDSHVDGTPFPSLRKTHPRCPWQDIACVVYGEAAYDVAVHFIQRWNFTKAQEKKQDILSRMYADIRPLVPKAYPTPPLFAKSHIQEQSRIKKLKIPDFYTRQKVKVQCLRSSGEWALGLRDTEDSIHRAYLDLITNAQEYVYIENQFFVTQCGSNTEGVENAIGKAICDVIRRHHRQGNKNFKIYIIIPHVPEFNFDALDCKDGFYAPKIVMFWQYWSILRSESSIFQTLQRDGINPDDYIYFACLRKFQKNPLFDINNLMSPSNRYVQCQTIYVHSKLLIVDDKHVVIGSANINDRSMCGNRDSEVCLYMKDTDYVKLPGMTDERGKFASFLRIKIWATLLGLDCNDMKVHNLVPSSEECWQFWKERAKMNLKMHQMLEPFGPIDEATSYVNMTQYKSSFQYPASPNAIDQICRKIHGVMIHFPLHFLEEEDLRTMPLTTKEGIAPKIMFQ